MWAPKILSIEDKGVIDSVGRLLIYTDGVARGRGRGVRESESGVYDREDTASKTLAVLNSCAHGPR